MLIVNLSASAFQRIIVSQMLTFDLAAPINSAERICVLNVKKTCTRCSSTTGRAGHLRFYERRMFKPKNRKCPALHFSLQKQSVRESGNLPDLPIGTWCHGYYKDTSRKHHINASF